MKTLYTQPCHKMSSCRSHESGNLLSLEKSGFRRNPAYMVIRL